MKFCVLIMDGASGWPLPEYGNKTCLELAETPNLGAMAREGTMGLASMVPPGMEPSSAIACMSVLGYDPRVYYSGRSGIEARSMGLAWGDSQVVFRCNLVAVRDGRMWSYSAGHIACRCTSASAVLAPLLHAGTKVATSSTEIAASAAGSAFHV